MRDKIGFQGGASEEGCHCLSLFLICNTLCALFSLFLVAGVGRWREGHYFAREARFVNCKIAAKACEIKVFKALGRYKFCQISGPVIGYSKIVS